ncbi:hypothetical protein CP960_06175 [Malaciobacter halophilus]|uniref:Uncharacterized protein n=1 Tax=Malaciobacter halophilus TaxID=197482 RepID=A0A2N1J3R2_9BACT|nr:hypothetical protein [Malaciobacter halophilus]AXH09059.1 putative membrane protein [Malaciobacter halophilus]PKI81144.1 hypothetical protein CP960_06175 [Malaciobacter halophilus]
MFKQVKSAIFWYYLYKFRKRVMIISALLIIAIFSNSIYTDVVQYLTLKDKLDYLEIALIIKWAIIVSNILISIYLVLTLFKKNSANKEEVKIKKEKPKSNIKKNNIKFTKREEEFLNKKELKTKAESLLDR